MNRCMTITGRTKDGHVFTSNDGCHWSASLVSKYKGHTGIYQCYDSDNGLCVAVTQDFLRDEEVLESIKSWIDSNNLTCKVNKDKCNACELSACPYVNEVYDEDN